MLARFPRKLTFFSARVRLFHQTFFEENFGPVRDVFIMKGWCFLHKQPSRTSSSNSNSSHCAVCARPSLGALCRAWSSAVKSCATPWIRYSLLPPRQRRVPLGSQKSVLSPSLQFLLGDSPSGA
jgi:hypothetical protein